MSETLKNRERVVVAAEMQFIRVVARDRVSRFGNPKIREVHVALGGVLARKRREDQSGTISQSPVRE